MPGWQTLTHAYGPAGDVPGLLRSLATGDSAAADELSDLLVHQGSRYPATVAAVPFLIDTFAGAGVAARAAAYAVLADIMAVDREPAPRRRTAGPTLAELAEDRSDRRVARRSEPAAARRIRCRGHRSRRVTRRIRCRAR
ncbi:hypothetical protein AB0C12_02475 [Actinoplanes sp. NPDC048967]|uniref:hypothetical protein n=1 Tax=Actinoplanes sp. NPDC048967 TaxID=3155269 RepID=UPI00340EF196